MKKQKNTLIDTLALTFLSFFGTGYSPKAPGTVGSLATIPLILLLSWLDISRLSLIILTFVLTIASCFVAEYIQQKRKVHDPGWIVIDEVIGMLVTWIFVFPSTQSLDLILVFGIFRFFDIIKFWPATYFDKKVSHGSGTILDDVISGVYAGLAILIVKNFL